MLRACEQLRHTPPQPCLFQPERYGYSGSTLLGVVGEHAWEITASLVPKYEPHWKNFLKSFEGDTIIENTPPSETPIAAESAPKSSGCAKVAIGCGILSLIAIIVGAISIWYVASNLREWGTDITLEAMKEGMQELQLPVDQQEHINSRLAELGQQFKDKKITFLQLGNIAKKLAEGPFGAASMTRVIEKVYLEPSGLTDEEKAAAKTTIKRFSQGVIQKTISDEDTTTVLDTISTVNAEGQREFKTPVTDEQLKAFLAAAKKAADDGNVPAEVPEVNFADEFDKAVTEGLKAGQAPPAAGEASS